MRRRCLSGLGTAGATTDAQAHPVLRKIPICRVSRVLRATRVPRGIWLSEPCSVWPRSCASRTCCSVCSLPSTLFRRAGQAPARAPGAMSVAGLARSAGAFAIGLVLAMVPQLVVWFELFGSIGPPPLRVSFMQPLPTHLPSVLASSNYGLLTWHPVWIVGFGGLLLLARRRPTVLIPLVVAFGAQLWFLGAASNWSGGMAFGQRRVTQLALCSGARCRRGGSASAASPGRRRRGVVDLAEPVAPHAVRLRDDSTCRRRLLAGCRPQSRCRSASGGPLTC